MPWGASCTAGQHNPRRYDVNLVPDIWQRRWEELPSEYWHDPEYLVDLAFQDARDSICQVELTIGRPDYHNPPPPGTPPQVGGSIGPIGIRAIRAITTGARVASAATAPVSGLKNAMRLSPDELLTGQRLEQLLGKGLRESPHVGAEYIDDLGRAFDALGGLNASKFWNEGKFLNSIRKHLLKSDVTTVIDLTGFTPQQIVAVQKFLGTLSPEELAKIIRIGF